MTKNISFLSPTVFVNLSRVRKASGDRRRNSIKRQEQGRTQSSKTWLFFGKRENTQTFDQKWLPHTHTHQSCPSTCLLMFVKTGCLFRKDSICTVTTLTSITRLYISSSSRICQSRSSQQERLLWICMRVCPLKTDVTFTRPRAEVLNAHLH